MLWPHQSRIRHRVCFANWKKKSCGTAICVVQPSGSLQCPCSCTSCCAICFQQDHRFVSFRISGKPTRIQNCKETPQKKKKREGSWENEMVPRKYKYIQKLVARCEMPFRADRYHLRVLEFPFALKIDSEAGMPPQVGWSTFVWFSAVCCFVTMFPHSQNMKRDNRKAVRRARTPENLDSGPAANGGSSAGVAWAPTSVQTGQAALDNLLKEDRLKRDKEIERMKWFHANTSRNLAESKLKEGGLFGKGWNAQMCKIYTFYFRLFWSRHTDSCLLTHSLCNVCLQNSHSSCVWCVTANLGEKKDGTFLVRENSASPGDFVLSLLYRKQASHYQIIQHGSVVYSIDSGRHIIGTMWKEIGEQFAVTGIRELVITSF